MSFAIKVPACGTIMNKNGLKEYDTHCNGCDEKCSLLSTEKNAVFNGSTSSPWKNYKNAVLDFEEIKNKCKILTFWGTYGT